MAEMAEVTLRWRIRERFRWAVGGCRKGGGGSKDGATVDVWKDEGNGLKVAGDVAEAGCDNGR
ncbi:hypothetical protein AMTR_s00034p00051380 [Amborella trichopoda]|uniref:Uncharacterized protein n=1 Tax=Amborella trichopoda TaxID=13333 RepID=W1PWL6_AMBTC|nr:hypothetical protein AMTR_s00034p00051380 [Amborella trichopoda]